MASPMPWFRIYSEIRNDPKMLALSGDQFRAWIFLLALANEHVPRGTVPAYPDRGLAWALGLAPDALDETLRLFVQLDMISIDEDDTITISKFIKRQYDKPSDHPERVAERKRRLTARRHEERGENVEGTQQERGENAPERDQSTEYRVQSTKHISAREGNESASAQTHVQPSARGDPNSPEAFSQFMSAYPKPLDRRKAWSAWCATLNDIEEPADPADLIAAATHYAEMIRVTGTVPKYTKRAATFIEHGTWRDYVDGIPEDELKGVRTHGSDKHGRGNSASGRGHKPYTENDDYDWDKLAR